MIKLISIDPGKCKCGLILAELSEKKVYEAIVLKTELLEDYVKNLTTVDDISKIVIGNGTNSKDVGKKLNFFKKEIVFFEEKNPEPGNQSIFAQNFFRVSKFWKKAQNPCD